MKVFGKKIDRTLIASIVLHVLFLCGIMFSLSSRAYTPPAEDVIPVDIVDVGDVSKVMQGEKTAPKAETPKPKVEKIADAKPTDNVGKVTDKPPVVTPTEQQQPPPTPPQKPVEKQPDPPKPVVEQKDPPKPAEKKPPPPPKDDSVKKDDPIKDALKDDAKQPPQKQQAAVTPPPKPPAPKPKERTFDADKLAELLDKRDPTRNPATGAELNNQASLGSAKGADASHAATWGAMFQQQVARCWNKPFASVDQNKFEPAFNIHLKQDGTLESPPVPDGSGPSTPAFLAYQESARRAIIDCQPYSLPPIYFNEWKFFTPVFHETT